MLCYGEAKSDDLHNVDLDIHPDTHPSILPSKFDPLPSITSISNNTQGLFPSRDKFKRRQTHFTIYQRQDYSAHSSSTIAPRAFVSSTTGHLPSILRLLYPLPCRLHPGTISPNSSASATQDVASPVLPYGSVKAASPPITTSPSVLNSAPVSFPSALHTPNLPSWHPQTPLMKLPQVMASPNPRAIPPPRPRST